MPNRPATDGDPGKPGRNLPDPFAADFGIHHAADFQPLPGRDPEAAKPLPPVTRINYDVLAQDVIADKPGDPSYKGKIANEAIRLEPLKQIQASYDQTVTHADNLRRGEPWTYPGGFKAHVDAAIAHAAERRDILKLAAAKAEEALAQITNQLNALENAMSHKRHPDDGPQLTTDGSEHPLVEGNYNADADPNLAANESDVNALKSGHTTKAQAEAIAKSDLANMPEEPTQNPNPTAEQAGATAKATATDKTAKADAKSKK